MKTTVLTFVIMLLACLFAGSQEMPAKSRRQMKAGKEAAKKEEIRNLLEGRDFEFSVTHALPMGGPSIFLNYFYSVKIKNDTVNSYLPFYGVAYHADYGARTSPFDFKQTVEDYYCKKDKQGYRIGFGVTVKSDHLNFFFQVSELGYATLSVTSTHRQPISYYGTIRKEEKVE